MTKESRGVQSVEVSGRILAALASAGRPLMLRDIAVGAEIAPAQAHAYLVSLRRTGLVEQDAQSGLYRVGPFALQLGLARLRAVDALRLASAAVAELADELDLMVTLTIWGTFGPTIIQVIEGTRQIHVNLRAGAVYSLTGTATGRIFGAFLPQATVKAHLDALAKEERGGHERIRGDGAEQSFADAVAEVRRRGFAAAEGSPIPGVNAISAPVFDHAGQLQLAVTVIGPARAVAIEADGALTARVLAFAADLSRRLGYDAGGAAQPFLRVVSKG